MAPVFLLRSWPAHHLRPPAPSVLAQVLHLRSSASGLFPSVTRDSLYPSRITRKRKAHFQVQNLVPSFPFTNNFEVICMLMALEQCILLPGLCNAQHLTRDSWIFFENMSLYIQKCIILDIRGGKWVCVDASPDGTPR